MNRHLKDSIMHHALRNMRYTLFILGCLLCTLPAHAVLKEKNLAHTLGVLKAELKADYEKQQVFMENYEMQSAGLATLKLELDATYMFTEYIGVFAKVAYCQNLDPHMRESADIAGATPDGYGPYNEFAWGGAGICVSF